MKDRDKEDRGRSRDRDRKDRRRSRSRDRRDKDRFEFFFLLCKIVDLLLNSAYT